MTEDSAGTDQRGGRRRYVKPFVRSLDVSVTDGGKTSESHETHSAPFDISFGPS